MKFDFQAIDFQAIGFKAVARRVATPLLALAICASAPAARAADMLGGGGPFAGDAPATFAASDVPQTYGTGWYIRGDADFGVGSITRVGGDGSGKISGSGLGGDVGFGYQYGNYLRVDWDFGGVQTKTSSFAGGASTAVTCVSALTAGPTAGSYVWAATGGTCTPQGGSSFGRLHTLLNGYVDLGDWWGVTPYVGAGAGIARLQGSYWQNYYTAAGAAYAANLTAAAGSTWYDPGCACTVNPVVPGTTTPV
ncbi:MAG: hypothetical protein KGQ28_11035, partial [Hyphomicrobiales bacterium]|nr:hypothetical protein [Hyphomicrobiales bacterium]